MRIGRVRTRAGFAALAARGIRARHGAVRLTAVLDEGADRAEVAFAIGRAVGSAVTRNRLRRQLRSAMAELDPAPGRYLVAVASGAVAAGYGQLRDDLAAALAQVGARSPVHR